MKTSVAIMAVMAMLALLCAAPAQGDEAALKQDAPGESAPNEDARKLLADKGLAARGNLYVLDGEKVCDKPCLSR